MAAPPPGVPAAGPSVGYGRIVRWIDYRLPFVAILVHDFLVLRTLQPVERRLRDCERVARLPLGGYGIVDGQHHCLAHLPLR